MQLGQLNKEITLYTGSTTTLSSGQKQVNYTEEVTVFAHVEYKQGDETFEADQKVATSEVIFTIHNVITNLSKQRKVVFNGESYEVNRIYPTTQNEFFLVIECKNRDNANIGV